MKTYTAGEVHSLTLTGLAIGGEATGRIEDLVVFVPYGVPGDLVEVRLAEVKKNYARGDIHRILKESPHRQKPPCPIFYRCGGCQLQQMSYAAQLIFKRRMVEDVLLHIGGISDVWVDDIIEAPSPWHYRNKMQVVAASKPFLHSTKTSPYFGLYARQTHQVVKMDECVIQHPLSNQLLTVAKNALARLGWTTYNENTGTGILRYLITRISTAKNELLLTIVSTTEQIPDISRFVRLVSGQMPNVRGILLNKNDKRSNVVLGSSFKTVWGDDYIIEEIEGLKFRLSANSFFQVNPPQIGKMFNIIDKFLDPQPRDVILDAYCGIGAISMWLAKKAGTVIGIEEIPQAKKDAYASTKMNDIKNLEFHVGRVEKVLPDLFHRGVHIDKVILDPPRKGCEASVLELLAKMRVKQIAYVSCNPATLARDLAYLKNLNYRIEQIIPLDMFPQTYHVECLVKLSYEPHATPAVLENRKTGEIEITEAHPEKKKPTQIVEQKPPERKRSRLPDMSADEKKPTYRVDTNKMDKKKPATNAGKPEKKLNGAGNNNNEKKPFRKKKNFSKEEK